MLVADTESNTIRVIFPFEGKYTDFSLDKKNSIKSFFRRCPCYFSGESLVDDPL